MEPDGSDVIALSFHETHEWNPSVNHDGMLVYTRWDYVDRDTDIAHHQWICYPDGRDPRAYHGNYPRERRRDRPWMEMQIRAIPGSHRYVAVAAAHHGQEFGSLVLIDTRIEDDGAMSQLTRLTPEVPFPESERRAPDIPSAMVYGTPWPLSEDDYLVVYDPDAKNRGIYWMDRDGNRELIYRDPEISCYAPMPLRSSARAAGDPAPDRPGSSGRRCGRRHRSAGDDRCDERLRQRFPVARRRPDSCTADHPCPAQDHLAGEPAADRRRRTDQRASRAGHRAGRVRWQRVLRSTGGQVDLFPGVGRRRDGHPVDALVHVRPSRRTTGLPGMPRAEAHAAASFRTGHAAGPAAGSVAHHSRTRRVPIRSATCGWSNRCSTNTASIVTARSRRWT
jgi:hypothetical protein